MTSGPVGKGVALAAGLLALGIAAPPQAAEFEAPAAIHAAIRAAVEPRIAGIGNATAEIAAIDPRLRLPACAALAVGLPGTSAPAMTAKVACPSPSWTIYVPIRLHAWTEAVVAATNLAPRTRLTAGNLARGRVDMFASPGELVREPAGAEGEVLQIGLLAGAPILKSYLQAPILVHRGERVLLTLTDRTMVVRDMAVALDDGRPGDTIALQNPESRKIVHATVAPDGTVAVRF
ncbi:MAG TPA: flagellar basal body P-ring formation chaperone FlgA [Stellaceae bacterium]|nr:flagellar basal body P-ring formation chaperone FlgA [Stellaceae bacterium]